jgi:hypothetical protein
MCPGILCFLQELGISNPWPGRRASCVCVLTLACLECRPPVRRSTANAIDYRYEVIASYGEKRE